MHFSFRKTLSLLNTHRRTSSEATPKEPQTNTTHRVRSWSLTKIEELIFGSSSQIAPKPFYVNVASPSLYQTTASSQRPALPTFVPQVDAEPQALENPMVSLQAKNDRLKDDIAALKLDAQIREEELAKFRSDYYAERFKANVRRRLVNALEARSQTQNDQLEQAEAFILSMIEIGLHQPVFSEAWQAVKVGRPSDDALVDAIKKAAAIPGTSWSSIIPAATGSRTRDQQLCPISLTLKPHKELNTTIKAAKFWKSPVKPDSSSGKSVTPSSSDLSSIKNDTIDHWDQTAVDDLLNRLREGDIPTKSPYGSNQGPHEIDPAPNSVDRVNARARISATDVTVPSSLNIRAHPITLADPPNPDRVQECTPLLPSHAADLAPLASQTFKDQRAATHRSPRRLRLSPSNQKRPAFGKIDLNRSVQRLNSLRKVTEKQFTKPSAKALRKRKAIIVTEDMQFISADSPPPDKRRLAVTQALPGQDPHTALRCSGDTSNTLHTVLNTGSAQTAQPLCDKGALSPETALLSLERICAGFSSGSLGSLAMISEDSEINLRHPCPAASNSLPDSQPTVISSIKPKLVDPASRTPPIFRKSALPVLKMRRAVSVPSKKSYLPPHVQPATHGEQDSAVLNGGITSSKRLIHKTTSPLRIAKGAKPSASDVVPRKPHTMGPMTTASITRGFSGGRFSSSKGTKPAKGMPSVAC